MKKKLPQQEFHLFFLNKKRNPNLFPDKPFIKNTPWFVFLALIFSVLFSGKANAQTTTETFSTSGTWVCPVGVTSVTLEIWGGGGSGGGSSTNNKGGSGGGGGGYSTKTIAVAGGDIVTYTIGAGGSSTITANGNTGQNTIANHSPSSTTLTANGGGFGTLNTGTGGTGGIASGGTNTAGINGGDGGGNTGGNGGNGGNTTLTGGNGGSNGNGLSGTIPGGGGGGGEKGSGNSSGGAGADGQIKFTYATPPLSNDDCSGAIALTVNPTLTCTTSTNGTTINATQSQVACIGSGADDDVWYSFTATSTSHILTVTPTTLSDVVFQVFSGTCAGTLTSLACVDNTVTTSAETTTLTGLTSGNTYFVRVHSYTNGSNQGTFSICVTTQPACLAPASQASAFILGTPTSTALPASFTGSANAYLVIQSLTNTPPATPVNGTIYSSGNIATLGTGLTFVQSSTSTSISGTGLNGNTQYYYFIYAYNNTACSGGPIYNASGPLTGNGNTCSAIPNAVATSNITSTGFTLGWTAPTGGSAGAITYTVQITTNAGYTANISGSPFSIAAPTIFLNLSGLTANTTYYYRILASNGCNSAYVTGTTHTGYCLSTSTSSAYYINNFSTTGGTANITNATGYSATGYGNFTAQSVSQQPYGSVNFSTTFFNGAYTYGFNIWVDWNDDLDFDDAGEKVYGSGAYVSSATGSFTVPGTAMVGNHRMRIRANYNSTNPSACSSITNGETEDYTFTVLASACPGIPTAVAISSITMTSATVNWSASSPAPSNGYQYYVTTSTIIPSIATTPTGNTAAGVTTVNLTGLLSDTTYYVYVRNNCGSSNYSPWTSQVIFTTGYCTANNSTNTTYYISGLTTTGGVTNFSNTGTGFSAGGYANYTGTYSVSQNSGASFNITATHPSSTYGYSVWVDWNNDFDFDDTDENVLITSYLSSPVAVGTVTIPASTPAGNYRMRIRNAYLYNPAPACGNQAYGETEDYTITALGPLPCAVNPTSVAVTVTSQTTATVAWTPPSPVPANGYQYYLSTLNTTPSASTTPTGVIGAGITNINLTGLTSGTTYYLWVRSDCGAPDGQGAWVDSFTFYQPNCVIGNSMGTSTLGCPSVLSGGLGLNGADSAAIVCTSGSSCVNLEATYLPLGDTTDYTVESIAYNPPYQFGCLQNPVSVNKDDVWSPVVNLPFNFCYYGNTYNSCLIGSNGILSFNTSNAGGATGYSFNNNLPSTTGALFANTIYGVYHDIDPSKGGEVGWELITLNTGCRALVASWNDVPMFSNNTILYTGMMVLYENTNVIEVYIQEKNIDGTWNGGNAIVGVQNAGGTQAVVAPGRNGLDADWTVSTVTNEAWRFVPSGVSITSIKWHEGSGTSGPVIGTTDAINVCPAVTTTYTAEVTYTLCNGTTLIENDETTVTVTGSKTWNGSSDTDWNKDINWTPVGIPNALDCVVIPNVTNAPIISGIGYNGLAHTLTVQNGGFLTTNSTNSITVTNVVNVDTGGTFDIKNSASLVQIDNVANTGIINMERFTQPMYRYDYTYWGSPVTQASGFTLGNLSPGSSLRYTWTPSVGGLSGNWAGASSATTMVAAKGYIVRAPDSFSTNPAIKVPFTANFIGTPNNGDILAPISHGTMGVIANDDKWNLLGNPYPSAVNANTFLDNATNEGLLDGTIYFWTHNSPPSTAFPDPFYASFVVNYTASDYASWNKTGGVGTIASSGGPAPDGFIAAGQSFFARSLGVTGNAVFNNSMRSATYSNSQFFRQANTTVTATNTLENLEKHRIWLNLTNNTGAFSQILVGYVQGATLGRDRNFDGDRFGGNGVNLYSIIPSINLGIQGRPLPFDVNDQVTLGYNAVAAGTFSIRIDHIDGLFNSQNIYLEDKLLQVIHDLKLAPYVFTTAAGNFNNRFVLRYTYNTLGNESFNLNNTIQVITNENATVYSYETIKDIIVYDVLGRKIDEYENVGVTQFILRNLNRTTSALIIKITLENGMMVTQKIIY